MNETRLEIIPGSGEILPETMRLNNTDLVELTGLSEAEKASLRMRSADGKIGLEAEAGRARLAVATLDATLNTLTLHAVRAEKMDIAATYRHTQKGVLGETEVTVGTEAASPAERIFRTHSFDSKAAAFCAGCIVLALTVLLLR